MPTNESWVLDGLILTSGTFQLLELNADPPPARMDWISAADSEAAALFRQPLHENRKITMKVRVVPQASMDTALDKVGLLVDKLRASSATPAGIGLVWTPAGSTRARTFTVLAGQITGLPIALSGDGYLWTLSSPILNLELTCHPYWLGTETLTSTAVATAPWVEKEITGVTGDIPALGRLIITDSATQSRRHVEWGLEGPLTYNAATSLLIDSDSMVTSGFAGTQTTDARAYDPNASGNQIITASVIGQPAAICGTGNLSHVGSFRVKARIAASTSTLSLRFAWQAGDGPVTTNAWVDGRGTGDGLMKEVDLGTITIPTVLSGTQRWTGRVEATMPPGAGTGTILVDYLLLIPTSDGYGKARATYAYTPGVVAGYDSFAGTTAAAVLNARAAPSGGSWATSGSATDLVFADFMKTGDGTECINRQTIAVETTGRLAILGTTNYTDTQVDVRFYGGANSESGLIARWTDASNHLRLRVPATTTGTTTTETVVVEQLVAGVVTVLGTASFQRTWNLYYRFRLFAFASGRVIGQVFSDTGETLATAEGSSTAIATGGTLASGEPGIWDRALSAVSTNGRSYTGFVVSVPASEPIVFYSGRSMQVRHDDTIRQDSTGTYTGRPASYRGSRFLVPVGTSRVMVKARRNDIEEAGDDNVIDSTTIQIGWTPRGLAVPR